MEKTDKILSGKGSKVFSIFFTCDDWYSLKEASGVYDPEFSGTSRNQSTVSHYFYKFKKLGWLDEKNTLKYFKRVSSKGKESLYPDKSPRYRSNYNFFFDGLISTELKDFLLFFLNQSFTRDYLIETYKNDIPSGIEDIIKQLFLMSIVLKQHGFKKKNTGFLDISNITTKNYTKVIDEKIQKYYSAIFYSTKKGKEFSELLKKTYPKNSFWFFLNLFSLVMIKLFFKKGFATELTKTSPKLYFWLRDMYGDFSFVN
jgi:hypothetical protein